MAAVALLALLIGHELWRSNSARAAPSQLAGTSTLSGSGSVPSLVDPSLVDITASLTYTSRTTGGTGIVLNPSGLVLTNNHVIAGATTICAIDVGNGQEYAATVLGYDRSQDVALLQLDGAFGLAAADLGDSSWISVGEPVVGIGNAGGVGGTPSAASGAVVALKRSIEASNAHDATSEHLDGLIATDANIRPGDSGGPLVDSAGQVIGLDTAASEGSSLAFTAREGFAIPIDAAMAVARRIENGQASATTHVGQTAFLGIGIAASHNPGVTIAQVFYSTPAAQAGLEAGDVIVSIAGQAVASPEALSVLLARYQPGEMVQIAWDGPSGARYTSTIQLAAGPPE
jgi:S1-C subfamily serine protease